MATWNSRGLRGSTLEEFINHSNERYSEMGLALMQKIPTPITPVRMDKDHRQITLFRIKTDRDSLHCSDIVYRTCFVEIRKCNLSVDFMEKFERQGGIAFFLIYYTARNELYYMQYTQIRKFWERAQSGGRKSVRLEELDPEWFFQLKNGYFVPYLDLIQKDLETRD